MKGKNTGRDGALSSLKQVRQGSRGFHSQFVDNSRTFSGMTSSVTLMRWDNLFDDLESQLESEIGAVEREVHDDIERERQAHLTLHARLGNLLRVAPVAATAEQWGQGLDVMALTLRTGQSLSVSLIRLGQDWCAVDVISPTALTGHALVPIAAIASLHPTESQLVASLARVRELGDREIGETEIDQTESDERARAPRIADAMSLGFVLRDLARRRRPVELHGTHGTYAGTLDRVGADHCDLAEHHAEDARRSGNVRGYQVIALSRIALIRIL